MDTPFADPQVQVIVQDAYSCIPDLKTSPRPLESSPFSVDDLRNALDDIVTAYSQHTTYTRFKREAAKAWERKYPDAKPPMGAFQNFVKTHMMEVRTAHPDASHQDHMKMLGAMWSSAKPQTIGVKRPAPTDM